VERRVNGVVERSEQVFNSALGQVERPLFSEKVKKNDDLEEYMFTIAQAPDPKAAFKRRIEERVAEGYSTEQALTWAVDWVDENEKRIMEIEWIDSSTKHGWDNDPNPGAVAIRSVGYVTEETSDHITLSESIALPSTASTYGCQTSIPKVAITKTRVLRNRK